jgi:subtilisin family serine protease
MMRGGRFSLLLGLLVFASLLLGARIASATPWVWDQDEDGVDDRLSDVAQNGISWAFENLDPGGRLRFEVGLVNSVLQYGAYVRYISAPTSADSLDATLLGAQVITVFKSVPYIRLRAFYPTLLLLAARPRVDRIEAVSLMYPLNWRSERALGVRAGRGGPFPTLEQSSSLTGAGIVVGVLDTGINDAPNGLYPGHEDVIGKVVGGAVYDGPGPAGYTPWNASVNPAQSSPGLNGYHGTHIAGSVAGASRSRLVGGVAPGARLVDVKVLGDQGSGSGVAEGLEWCIQNRNRAWGGGATGIDVLNLSFSGTDLSDGSDCICALVDAAVGQGISVVTSAGNHADCAQLSNPGAADGAITVGAYDPGSDPGSEDDHLASFTAYGPRVDDGDGTQVDEEKPDVVAPGVDVVSAWGSPGSSGHAYASASGTSMSAAFVSGVIALLLEEDPGLTPSGVKQLLRDTARHRQDGGLPCGAMDPFGIDARYHTGWGFGEVDALAAFVELHESNQTQFVQLSGAWNDVTDRVDVTWTTQRETNISGFEVERAPDVNGNAGAYVTIGTTPALGSSTLVPVNRTTYLSSDAAAPGAVWWYRIKTSGGSTFSPAIQVRSEAPTAWVHVQLDHNIPEIDLDLTLGTGIPQTAPAWQEALDLAALLDSVTVSGPSDLLSSWLSAPIWSEAGGALPPGSQSPWWIRAVEGGNTQRSGFLREFSLVAGGTTFTTDSTTPQPTLEGGAVSLWIPEPASVGIPDDSNVALRLIAAPNPFRSGTDIVLGTVSGPARVSIHDLSGRVVRELWRGNGGDLHLAWDGRDGRGFSVPSGTYFLRVEDGSRVRALRLVRIP